MAHNHETVGANPTPASTSKPCRCAGLFRFYPLDQSVCPEFPGFFIFRPLPDRRDMFTKKDIVSYSSRGCPIKRFMRKVEKLDSGCWGYVGAKDQYGYGKFSVGRRRLGAHRISYAIHCGDIPDDMVVMHKCDNPACVNPDHLTLGTVKDNVHDCIEKGRFPPSPKRDRKRSVVAIGDSLGYYFPDIYQAQAAGFHNGGVSRAARGLRMHYKGYQWLYINQSPHHSTLPGRARPGP